MRKKNSPINAAIVPVLFATVQFCVAGSVAAADQVDAGMLVYKVSEPGGAPYFTRFLVTPEFVRVDDPEDSQGFVIMNRDDGEILSVSHEERTMVVVDPEKAATDEQAAVKLKRTIGAVEAGTPKIGGVQPVHINYTVEQDVCQQAVVAPDLLPAVREGVVQYYQRLSDQERITMALMPADMQVRCDLAIYRDDPASAFSDGLPVIIWYPDGRRWELVDFDDSTMMSLQLMQTPDGYSRQAISSQ